MPAALAQTRELASRAIARRDRIAVPILFNQGQSSLEQGLAVPLNLHVPLL
jgi:hypothetical protein